MNRLPQKKVKLNEDAPMKDELKEDVEDAEKEEEAKTPKN